VLGRVVELPPPSTRLPREKPLPRPKPPTKWEEYAKKKGIVKRKRSQRVWDEEQGEWRGRHGFNRVADPNDTPIVEAKAWEQSGAEDPFTLGEREKKSRVSAQAWREAANVARGAKAGGGGKSRALAGASGGLPGLADARGAPLGVVKTAAIAARSTASKGAFCPWPLAALLLYLCGGPCAVQPTAHAPCVAETLAPARLRRGPPRCASPGPMGVHLLLNAADHPWPVAGLTASWLRKRRFLCLGDVPSAL
jgi:hypothetical protein